mmetsp:Transcript_88981/g.248490  ORF Transcript_88981/g.248490 Transcript_88981/m.248490 type:complete len:365 (-) Transcript_88981:98-1192(-)
MAGRGAAAAAETIGKETEMSYISTGQDDDPEQGETHSLTGDAEKGTVDVEAAKKGTKKPDTPAWLAYAALVMLTAQNSSAVLVMRYTRATETQNHFLPQTAVIMQELLKALTSMALVLNQHGTLSTTFEDRGELLKSGIPAFLYLVQNNLQYLGLSYLQAAIFQVTYQLKILSTAILSVVILGKSLKGQQWAALVVLTIGVVVVQLSEMSQSQGKTGSSNLTLGLTFTLMATLSSGLAGVYTEKLFKGGSKLDLWQRNTQLGLYSVIIGCGGLVTTGQSATVLELGFFHGYTMVTFASIALQGLGGLLIAIVIKYTDNIMKNIATSLSIVLSAVVSVFVFDSQLTVIFFVGAFLVNAAAYWYSR